MSSIFGPQTPAAGLGTLPVPSLTDTLATVISVSNAVFVPSFVNTTSNVVNFIQASINGASVNVSFTLVNDVISVATLDIPSSLLEPNTFFNILVLYTGDGATYLEDASGTMLYFTFQSPVQYTFTPERAPHAETGVIAAQKPALAENVNVGVITVVGSDVPSLSVRVPSVAPSGFVIDAESDFEVLITPVGEFDSAYVPSSSGSVAYHVYVQMALRRKYFAARGAVFGFSLTTPHAPLSQAVLLSESAEVLFSVTQTSVAPYMVPISASTEVSIPALPSGKVAVGSILVTAPYFVRVVEAESETEASGISAVVDYVNRHDPEYVSGELLAGVDDAVSARIWVSIDGSVTLSKSFRLQGSDSLAGPYTFLQNNVDATLVFTVSNDLIRGDTYVPTDSGNVLVASPVVFYPVNTWQPTSTSLQTVVTNSLYDYVENGVHYAHVAHFQVQNGLVDDYVHYVYGQDTDQLADNCCVKSYETSDPVGKMIVVLYDKTDPNTPVSRDISLQQEEIVVQVKDRVKLDTVTTTFTIAATRKFTVADDITFVSSHGTITDDADVIYTFLKTDIVDGKIATLALQSYAAITVSDNCSLDVYGNLTVSSSIVASKEKHTCTLTVVENGHTYDVSFFFTYHEQITLSLKPRALQSTTPTYIVDAGADTPVTVYAYGGYNGQVITNIAVALLLADSADIPADVSSSAFVHNTTATLTSSIIPVTVTTDEELTIPLTFTTSGLSSGSDAVFEGGYTRFIAFDVSASTVTIGDVDVVLTASATSVDTVVVFQPLQNIMLRDDSIAALLRFYAETGVAPTLTFADLFCGGDLRTNAEDDVLVTVGAQEYNVTTSSPTFLSQSFEIGTSADASVDVTITAGAETKMTTVTTIHFVAPQIADVNSIATESETANLFTQLTSLEATFDALSSIPYSDAVNSEEFTIPGLSVTYDSFSTPTFTIYETLSDGAVSIPSWTSGSDIVVSYAPSDWSSFTTTDKRSPPTSTAPLAVVISSAVDLSAEEGSYIYLDGVAALYDAETTVLPSVSKTLNIAFQAFALLTKADLTFISFSQATADDAVAINYDSVGEQDGKIGAFVEDLPSGVVVSTATSNFSTLQTTSNYDITSSISASREKSTVTLTLTKLSVFYDLVFDVYIYEPLAAVTNATAVVDNRTIPVTVSGGYYGMQVGEISISATLTSDINAVDATLTFTSVAAYMIVSPNITDTFETTVSASGLDDVSLSLLTNSATFTIEAPASADSQSWTAPCDNITVHQDLKSILNNTAITIYAAAESNPSEGASTAAVIPKLQIADAFKGGDQSSTQYKLNTDAFANFPSQGLELLTDTLTTLTVATGVDDATSGSYTLQSQSLDITIVRYLPTELSSAGTALIEVSRTASDWTTGTFTTLTSNWSVTDYDPDFTTIFIDNSPVTQALTSVSVSASVSSSSVNFPNLDVVLTPNSISDLESNAYKLSSADYLTDIPVTVSVTISVPLYGADIYVASGNDSSIQNIPDADASVLSSGSVAVLYKLTASATLDDVSPISTAAVIADVTYAIPVTVLDSLLSLASINAPHAGFSFAITSDVFSVTADESGATATIALSSSSSSSRALQTAEISVTHAYLAPTTLTVHFYIYDDVQINLVDGTDVDVTQFGVANGGVMTLKVTGGYDGLALSELSPATDASSGSLLTLSTFTAYSIDAAEAYETVNLTASATELSVYTAGSTLSASFDLSGWTLIQVAPNTPVSDPPVLASPVTLSASVGVFKVFQNLRMPLALASDAALTVYVPVDVATLFPFADLFAGGDLTTASEVSLDSINYTSLLSGSSFSLAASIDSGTLSVRTGDASTLETQSLPFVVHRYVLPVVDTAYASDSVPALYAQIAQANFDHSSSSIVNPNIGYEVVTAGSTYRFTLDGVSVTADSYTTSSVTIGSCPYGSSIYEDAASNLLVGGLSDSKHVTVDLSLADSQLRLTKAILSSVYKVDVQLDTKVTDVTDFTNVYVVAKADVSEGSGVLSKLNDDTTVIATASASQDWFFEETGVYLNGNSTSLLSSYAVIVNRNVHAGEYDYVPGSTPITVLDQTFSPKTTLIYVPNGIPQSSISMSNFPTHADNYVLPQGVSMTLETYPAAVSDADGHVYITDATPTTDLTFWITTRDASGVVTATSLQSGSSFTTSTDMSELIAVTCSGDVPQVYMLVLKKTGLFNTENLTKVDRTAVAVNDRLSSFLNAAQGNAYDVAFVVRVYGLDPVIAGFTLTKNVSTLSAQFPDCVDLVVSNVKTSTNADYDDGTLVYSIQFKTSDDSAWYEYATNIGGTAVTVAELNAVLTSLPERFLTVSGGDLNLPSYADSSSVLLTYRVLVQQKHLYDVVTPLTLVNDLKTSETYSIGAYRSNLSAVALQYRDYKAATATTNAFRTTVMDDTSTFETSTVMHAVKGVDMTVQTSLTAYVSDTSSIGNRTVLYPSIAVYHFAPRT